MVEILFRGRSPRADNAVLDPGCGTGEFIDGVIRWCQRRRLALPRITGVESDPRHLPALRAKYARVRAISIEHADFLTDGRTSYDYIVGNPPYVRIQNMVAYSPIEVEFYKSEAAPYSTSKQDNFDKYALFIERGLRLLKPSGRLSYIVPHKFLTIRHGRPLRRGGMSL